MAISSRAEAGLLDAELVHSVANKFVHFLETGDVPPGLFSADVLCDFTLPKWRLQAQGVDGVVRLRKQGHPGTGTVPRWRADATRTGFVIEFEERWQQDGKDWYSREMARADVTDGVISLLSVYCTGDWDAEHREKHAREVSLIRP